MAGDFESDVEFSLLEQLAFQGKWDRAEKARVWKAAKLDKMLEKGLATTPEHDRLQYVTVVYSQIRNFQDPDGSGVLDVDLIKGYIEMYPSCAAHVPDHIAKMISDAQETEAKGKQS